MIGISEWMLLGAGLTIGGGAGAIFGGLFAGGRHSGCETKVARLQRRIEELKEACVQYQSASRYYGREVGELRAFKHEIEAQRRAAGEKGRAVQASKRLEKQAQERLIKQARHAEMRAKFGTAELV